MTKWRNDMKDKSQIKLNDITVPLKSATVTLFICVHLQGQ